MDKLISFALPLMISGILQLAFNAVDIIVVGQFSGSKSLAAVGSTTALINVFVNLFMGISLGANVLAARFYAAGKEKEMSKTVHSAIMIALISGHTFVQPASIDIPTREYTTLWGLFLVLYLSVILNQLYSNRCCSHC